jgi:anaerobic ribonucleoside-triphosphate reductase activating protein
MLQHSPWGEIVEVLRLARRANRCTVLGPGVRAVLWVQGCPFRCTDCVAPETWPFRGGTEVRVDDLANELSALPDIEGVTFSGGEPMSQAAPLVALIDRLRGRRDFSFVCYTGYTLEYLQQNGSSAQRALLERLDILIDGPYIPSRHTDLRWRGSDNQRVLFLSDRYRHLASLVNDRGTWMEIEYASDGSVHWMGIPPRGFRTAFEQALTRIGITLVKESGCE